MKGHVKRTLEVLEALGFSRQDDSFGRRKWSFHHAYDPDCVLKVWEGQSEAACIAVQQKAHAISETGTSGPAMPKNVGRRAHKKQRPAGPTVIELAREDRKAAREDRKVATDRARAIEDEEHRRHEIEKLMQPGRGGIA